MDYKDVTIDIDGSLFRYHPYFKNVMQSRISQLMGIDYKDVTIAIDGSLFRYHPHFKNVMQSRISQMMGINYKFDLLLSEDGSGRGAALVAAVLKRDEN